jgi:hypothetical protein
MTRIHIALSLNIPLYLVSAPVPFTSPLALSLNIPLYLVYATVPFTSLRIGSDPFSAPYQNNSSLSNLVAVTFVRSK